MAEDAEGSGTRTFRGSGADYDRFMGRYSRGLAPLFADFCEVHAPMTFLDVGCGPGALTAEAAARLGVAAVRAVDPAPQFVEVCRARLPGVEVRLGPAEELPVDDSSFDAAAAQLVLHFVRDADLAATELRRVVRPGGVVGACVWDFADGMEMLRAYWDAALSVDPEAPDEATTLRFGGPGEIVALFEGAGLVDTAESLLTVHSTYETFDELWGTFLLGIGPAGTHCAGLDPDRREAVRVALSARLGDPKGRVRLSAVARAATARVPA